MIDDLKKSFKEIIYERTTSPFYGTLITSWLIWNWRIIYVTFFVSESKVGKNKIDYIIDNFSDIMHIVVYPILSTIILLTVIPFLSNGAFWLSLKFNKWKVDQKNVVDKKKLLSLEQSINLREEIARQEERFAKLVDNKNLEISQLNLEISELKDKNEGFRQQLRPKTIEDVELEQLEFTKSEIYQLAERIKLNKSELRQYEVMLALMQSGYQLTERSDITSKFITLLESYDIIENKGNGSFRFTAEGKKLQRLMIDE